MLDIQVQNNPNYSITQLWDVNLYSFVEAQYSIDCLVEIKENGNLLVTGKGSKKCNNYIKETFKTYMEDVKQYETLKNNVNILLEGIQANSNNKITFEEVAIYKEANIFKCFVRVLKLDNEYGFNKKIGYMIIDCSNYEIIESKAWRNKEEVFSIFIKKYNAYINPVETIENIQEDKKEIESTPTSQGTKINNMPKYFIGKQEFKYYELAEKYCIENDFLPELMIKIVEG